MKYPLFCFVGISTMTLLLITREKEPSAVNNKAESVTRNVFWNNVNNSKMNDSVCIGMGFKLETDRDDGSIVNYYLIDITERK